MHVIVLFGAVWTVQEEYGRELKAYLDANGLKPSDLVKPKVRKKETKKPQPSQVGEMQQLAVENQHQWPASAGGAVEAARLNGPGDDLLVYHVRTDGTQECYVQRADGSGMNPTAAAAAAARDVKQRLLTFLIFVTF